MGKCLHGRWWLAAWLLPLATSGLALAWAWLTPRSESDWLGLARLFMVGTGVVTGSLLSAIAAGISFARREPLAGLALIPAIPGAIFAIWLAVASIGRH